MSKIGYNIKKIRGINRLSQQSFADLFEISRGNISSYEEMRAEPKLETIIKIAKYFSIGLEDLLTKELSINEIINFNHQKIVEQAELNQKRLAKIPYLDTLNLRLYLSKELEFDHLPAIEFPIQSSHVFIAIENHDDISNHLDFNFAEHTILFFEEILLDNIHTLDGQFGMFFNADELFIGKYVIEQETIDLVLNNWKKKTFDPSLIKRFWRFYGKFEKVHR